VSAQVNANKKECSTLFKIETRFDTTDLELEQWKTLNSLSRSTFLISDRRLFYRVSIGFFKF